MLALAFSMIYETGEIVNVSTLYTTCNVGTYLDMFQCRMELIVTLLSYN